MCGKCQFCHKTHNMKNYKFPINEKSQKLLEADMRKIEEEYENAHYEIYYRLKKSIEKMTNLIGIILISFLSIRTFKKNVF